MHFVTFLFVCIETVILFYLVIYKLARPNDRTATLNIILISLLIIYNISGGLLPDPQLPGSYFIQTSLAYATGFITPSYFPYYVYKAFALKKMGFHAYKGVFLCLIVPFVVFVLVFAFSGTLQIAKNILVLPMAYALWVIYSLNKAVHHKYRSIHLSNRSKQERIVLFVSLTPWVGLPLIDILDMGQALEATITNFGFLSLFAFQVKYQVKDLRLEHQRLIDSEQKLRTWNTTLHSEVDKRTKELAKINEQQMNTFINLAHETKTPLTLVNNYIEEYLAKHEVTEELTIVKKNLDKLSADIVNLFDLEKFKKGFAVYNYNQVCHFSKQLDETIPLFRAYASKRSIRLTACIDREIYVKADPLSINRIVNNLVENAIKFSECGGLVHVSLQQKEGTVHFKVKDAGVGISKSHQTKIFEPYFQISSKKLNTQGMGLGLPIVKSVIDDIGGKITINSEPDNQPGTEVLVCLPAYTVHEDESVAFMRFEVSYNNYDDLACDDFISSSNRKTLFIVEDNKPMLIYLAKKLGESYNVYTALNGNEALKKLHNLQFFPDLIISDIMMDKLDGYGFATVLSKNDAYNHIPIIFLTAKSSPMDRLKGLKLGAIDVVQKPFSFKELLLKIQSVLSVTDRQDKALFKNFSLRGKFFDKKKDENPDEQFQANCHQYHLTQREKDIALLVCKGNRYKLIAETLFVSEKTVAKHIENIFSKVGVSNKVELINKLDYHHRAQP